MALGILYSDPPIYPVFYLLKGDYIGAQALAWVSGHKLIEIPSPEPLGQVRRMIGPCSCKVLVNSGGIFVYARNFKGL